MKSRSIVRRLIVTILLMELVSVVALSTASLLHERRDRFTAFDVTLRGHADSLLGAIQEDQHDNLVIDKTGLNLPSRDVFHVQDETGAIIGQSPNWGDGPSFRTEEHRRDPHNPEGFFSLILNGGHYRAIRTSATRVIDPDEQGGGVRHRFTIIYAAPTHHLWHGILEAVGFYTIASLLLLAATGIAMVWLLNRGMSPLREIAAKASTVSTTSWAFEPSEEVLSTKELGPLARTLQTVLKDLEYSFTQQRRFVSDAAHELKTAVAVVQSSIQVLALKTRTVDEYRQGLDQCHADSVRMEEIVGKMLTLARVEREASPHEAVVQADLAESLRRTADQLASVAELNGITVQLPRLDPAPIQLSPLDAEILCSNLLLNSIQHSNPGSQITATVTRQASTIEMKVEDQGKGIAPEALPFIFERFYRSDPSRNRQTGGTGLGLAICKAIVDSAHGQITMTSTPGQGTIATVTLPTASAA
jgi:signal transduction histidine kinase